MGIGGLRESGRAATVAAMVTIHVIDRDPRVRLAARRALEIAGFMVSEAADAAGVGPPRPALILADLAAASLKAIRQRHPAAPVLALNSADGVATPFTPSQLLAAVRRCLACSATTAARRR